MGKASLLVQLAATPPDHADPADHAGRWREHFQALARELLHEHVLQIAGKPHRLVEIEFYLHAKTHPDPFTHRSEAQLDSGRWYFHRAGQSYRGGSFKGLDISFGPHGDHGGILIRSLRSEAGILVNGCSLCVDAMLEQTQSASVAQLDAAIAGRSVDDNTSPLALVPASAEARPQIWPTARVGLTLKRADEHPSMLAYVARPYRFLTEPRAIKKGRVQLLLAMHQAGMSVDELRRLTASPRSSIERYLTAHAQGADADEAASFIGHSLDPAALCRLFGALSRPGSLKA